MIDFRYHLVSLISVFLALAVGIALGAGPLKESIGDTLTGQVDQLRAEKDELRLQVEDVSADLAAAEEAITQLTPSLVDGILGGRRVAVVVLGTVDPTVLESLTTVIGQAGGSVSAVATVTPAWVDPGRDAFRAALASTLGGYLATPPSSEATTEQALAQALAQGLTTADPANPDALAESGVVLELLAGDAGLVTLAQPVTAPADAVVVLAGPITAATEEVDPSVSPTTDPDPEAVALEVAAWTEVATAAQRHSAGAVLAGADVAEAGVVAAVRADLDLAALVSTVDGLPGPYATVAVPLALTARIAGTVGQYGVAETATTRMPPRVALPPIERVPTLDPTVTDPTATDPAATDPAATATDPASEATEPAGQG